MVYRFTIISNEVEDFIREIKIDAEATFYNLHQAILFSCHYADNVPTSFFICNQEWEQDSVGRHGHKPLGRRPVFDEKDTAQRAVGRRETTYGLCFRPVGQPHVFH